jgi:hypothetical protein
MRGCAASEMLGKREGAKNAQRSLAALGRNQKRRGVAG